MQKKQEPQDMFAQLWLEESIEELYEDAPCGYLSTLQDGTIVKVNRTLTRWLGYSKEELLRKKKFQQLLTIGGQIFYETHHAPLLDMQGFVTELNYEAVGKDGKHLPILINAVQKKDKKGKATFNRITIFDYSDRKKYEIELLLEKKKAEKAMQVKSQFLSTVTHEIRTPIHAILGASDLLMKSRPRQDQMELLNTLKFSASNLLSLINDILDISKIESGKLKLNESAFNLKRLATNIVNSLKPRIVEKGIDVHLELDNRLSDFYYGDSLTIGRILTNLLSNAIKFTPRGYIRVTIEAQPTTDNWHSLDFTVSDTGIGIPEEKKDIIFEAFTQADESIHDKFGGTGLGLTICRKLLSLYDSSLHVESEERKGSTFYFNLKLEQTQSPALANALTEDRTLLNGLKVLLAEDNRSNILIASKYFEQWGLEYDVAANGKMAVEMVTRNEYDIVLMDLKMPQMNGYEATRQIRSLPGDKYRKLPVIALSATASITMTTQMKNAGIDALISKPFHPDHLYNSIKNFSRLNLPKPAPPAEVSNPAKSEATEPPDHSTPPINTEEISEILENDNASLQEYYEALVKDLAEVREGFTEAITNFDESLYGDMVHKTISFVRIFKARQFKDVMDKARLFLRANQKDQLLAIQPGLFAEMDRIVTALEGEIDRLKK